MGKAGQLKSGACWVKEGSADVPPQSLINKSQGGDLFTCSRVDGRLTIEVSINKSGYPIYYARFLNFLPSRFKIRHTVLKTPLRRLSLTVTQVYIFLSPHFVLRWKGFSWKTFRRDCAAARKRKEKASNNMQPRCACMFSRAEVLTVAIYETKDWSEQVPNRDSCI